MLSPKREPELSILVLRPDQDNPNKDEFDPYVVFKQMFGNYHLRDVYDYLWGFFKAAITSDQSEDGSTGFGRCQLIFFYECLLDIMTAAYVIAREKFPDNKILSDDSDNDDDDTNNGSGD